MTLDIQNWLPSRENVEEDVPLRQPQIRRKQAEERTIYTGFSAPMAFRIKALSPLPDLAMTMKITGMMIAVRTPLSRKMGVRFMIRHSRQKTALTGRRPDETRRDISA
jgi:hypothetical protein